MTGESIRKDEREDLAEQLLAELDLSGWAIIVGPFAKELDGVAAESGRKLLQQLELDADDEAWDIVDQAAQRFAQARAAELVGMRLLSDGGMVANPRAAFAITDGTRALLKATVKRAIDEGWSSSQLQHEVMDSAAFSPARSLNIARTESARAHSLGGLEAAKASGVVRSKSWLTGSEHPEEDDCDLDENEGAIPIEQAFPSGDDAPPNHPSCECTLIFGTEEP